jgi:hypothetical protein
LYNYEKLLILGNGVLKVDNSLKTVDNSGISVDNLAKTVDKERERKFGYWRKLNIYGLSPVFWFLSPVFAFFSTISCSYQPCCLNYF